MKSNWNKINWWAFDKKELWFFGKLKASAQIFWNETADKIPSRNIFKIARIVKEKYEIINYLSSLSPEKIMDGLAKITQEYIDFIKANPNNSPFISDPYLRKVNDITRDHPLNATCPELQSAIVYDAKSFIGVNWDKKQKSIHELYVWYNFWVTKRLAKIVSPEALEKARALKIEMIEKLKQEWNHIKIKFYWKEYELIEHGWRYFDISHIEDPNFFYLKLIIGFSAPKKDAEWIEIIELTPEIIKEHLV